MKVVRWFRPTLSYGCNALSVLVLILIGLTVLGASLWNRMPGFTFCVPVLRLPLPVVRPLLPEELRIRTRAHEEVHVRQIRTFGCEGREERGATPEGQLRLEVEAFCAEVALFDGEKQRQVFEEAVDDLMTYYKRAASLGEERVRTALEASCGPETSPRGPPAG